MADENEQATPVTDAEPLQKVNRGRKKPAPQVYPRAGENATAEEMRNAAEVRAIEATAKQAEAAKTPWPNFNAPPVNSALDPATIKNRRDYLEAERLNLLPGYKHYRAKRNCRNGKYRQGKVYALPEPQSKVLFELVE